VPDHCGSGTAGISWLSSPSSFFLRLDDQLSPLELGLQSGLLAFQPGQFLGSSVHFTPTLLRLQACQLSGVALPPPLAQLRAVQPLPLQQCPQFAWSTSVGFLQDAQLVLGGETPSHRTGNNLAGRLWRGSDQGIREWILVHVGLLPPYTRS